MLCSKYWEWLEVYELGQLLVSWALLVYYKIVNDETVRVGTTNIAFTLLLCFQNLSSWNSRLSWDKKSILVFRTISVTSTKLLEFSVYLSQVELSHLLQTRDVSSGKPIKKGLSRLVINWVILYIFQLGKNYWSSVPTRVFHQLITNFPKILLNYSWS